MGERSLERGDRGVVYLHHSNGTEVYAPGADCVMCGRDAGWVVLPLVGENSVVGEKGTTLCGEHYEGVLEECERDEIEAMELKGE